MKEIVKAFKEGIYKKKDLLFRLYAVLAIGSCFFTLSQLSRRNYRQYSIGLCFFCLVICLYSVLKLQLIEKLIREIFDRPWKKIIRVLLEIYGAFAMTGMYYFQTEYSTVVWGKRYPEILYFILTYCWVRPVIDLVMALFVKAESFISYNEHSVNIKSRLILIIIMMAPCVPFLVAFNPAITSPDSRYCYMAAHALWEPGFSMLNWHPPFYVFIMSLFLKIYNSVSYLIVVQYICFSLVFVDGIIFLYRCGYSKKAVGTLYIFVAFSVNHIILLTTLWRDVPYTISILWLTILLMKYIMRYEIYKDKVSWYIQYIFAVIFTAFFRQNGILPAVVIIIIFPFVVRFAKKVLLSSLICVLLMGMVVGPLYDFMNVIPAPQQKFIPLANDIMLSYYVGEPVSEDAMEVINKMTANDPDNYTFSPYYVHFLSNYEPSGYSVPDFMRIYIGNIIDNPRMMLAAIALRSSAAWSIVRPRDEPATCANFLGEQVYEQGSYPDEWIYPLRKENVLTDILTIVCKGINSVPVLNVIYWRTGIYNLLMLLVAGITFCSSKKQRIYHILPFIPILVHFVCIVFASGWSDYRIYWPSMPVGMFLLFFFFYNRKRQLIDVNKG